MSFPGVYNEFSHARSLIFNMELSTQDIFALTSVFRTHYLSAPNIL